MRSTYHAYTRFLTSARHTSKAYVGEKITNMERIIDHRQADAAAQLEGWRSTMESGTLEKVSNMERVLGEVEETR